MNLGLLADGRGRRLTKKLDHLGRQVENPIRAALSPQEVKQRILLTRRAVDALTAVEPR